MERTQEPPHVYKQSPFDKLQNILNKQKDNPIIKTSYQDKGDNNRAFRGVCSDHIENMKVNYNYDQRRNVEPANINNLISRTPLEDPNNRQIWPDPKKRINNEKTTFRTVVPNQDKDKQANKSSNGKKVGYNDKSHGDIVKEGGGKELVDNIQNNMRKNHEKILHEFHDNEFWWGKKTGSFFDKLEKGFDLEIADEANQHRSTRASQSNLGGVEANGDGNPNKENQRSYQRNNSISRRSSNSIIDAPSRKSYTRKSGVSNIERQSRKYISQTPEHHTQLLQNKTIGYISPKLHKKMEEMENKASNWEATFDKQNP